MEKRVFLIYDLGFDGDYSRLYRWLDELGAKECVVGGATFLFDFQCDVEDRDEMMAELKRNIPINIEESPNARIYAITKAGDISFGRFLFGSRKVAPWYGMSRNETDEEDG